MSDFKNLIDDMKIVDAELVLSVLSVLELVIKHIGPAAAEVVASWKSGKVSAEEIDALHELVKPPEEYL
ncbi:hypothetical protein N9104_01715 [Pseudomonadales bacterium]|nr:hypothetical protein [Pseudomonadales bacterium]